MRVKRQKGAGYFLGFILAAIALHAQPTLGVINILTGTGIPPSLWTVLFLICAFANLFIGFHPYYKFNALFFAPWSCYFVGTIWSTSRVDFIPWIGTVAYGMLLHSMLVDAGVYELILTIYKRGIKWVTAAF